MALALLNLLNTIDFHFLQPLPCLVFDDTEIIMIQSLCKKLQFLQAFLEKNNINHQERIGLETEIRDVARDAELKIESELHQLYLCYNHEESPVEPCQSLHQTLQRVTRGIESIEGRIQIESNRNHSVEQQRRNAIQNIKADSSSNRTSQPKNVMVGGDDEFETVKHKLISHSKNLEVISIMGMGGIGKTTLTKRVYEDEAITCHFYIRAWATASQQHNLREMLRGLLSNIETNNEGGNSDDLASKPRQELLGKRYLIVIDDIWSTQAWDDIHRCFPEDNNGSRILLTTRLKHVAAYASSGNHPHSMRFLNPNESWNLFYKKVFEEKNFPLEFERVGRGIVEKCQGLPLTIIVVAGLLTSSSKSSLDQWGKFAENLNSLLNTDPEEKCSKILSLSYNHLPPHLKVCFLYFGVLHEDSEIHVKKLIRLWVAEGFLKLELSQTMEEVAYDYLLDLVDRGLVQIDKWSSCGGKIKSCKLHDLLHSFCLREAQRENLLCAVNENNVHELVGLEMGLDQKAWRWISNQLRHSGTPITRERWVTQLSQELRSYLLVTKMYEFNFAYKSLPFSYPKLLRVLDISQCVSEYIPSAIVSLVHLRYLAAVISYSASACLYDIQWFRHRSLQTCIIKIVGRAAGMKLGSPNNILDMQQIRHVHMPPYFIKFPKLVLENLQTLSWLTLSLRLQTKPDFKRIPNLKELGIFLTRFELWETCLFEGTWDLLPHVSFDGLVDLHQLQKLKIMTIPPDGLEGNLVIGDIKLGKVFPSNLKELTLTGTCVLWEDMAIIGTLPNLEVLKLKYRACCGPEWKALGNGFCKLKYLQIGNLDLEHWSVDADHFPVLEYLFLKGLPLLGELPIGFAEINTLKLINLEYCRSSLVSSAKKIQEERQELGDDKLVVCDLYTGGTVGYISES